MENEDNNLAFKIALVIIVVCGLFLAYSRWIDGTILFAPDEIKIGQVVNLTNVQPYFGGPIAGEIVGAFRVNSDKEVYKVGEEVNLLLGFCHRRNLTPVILSYFVNDSVTVLPLRPSPEIKTGCYDEFKLPVGKIPPLFALSPPKTLYQIRVIMTYTINPIKKVSYLLIGPAITVSHP